MDTVTHLHITLQRTVSAEIVHTAAMHTERSEPGSVPLVSRSASEVLVHSKTTEAMNSFVKSRGNTQYRVYKAPQCREYHIYAVYLVECGDGRSVAKALISDGVPIDELIGPVTFSFNTAAKAFWKQWIEGTHRHKNDDGSPATPIVPNFFFHR
jgi:hypothetical protein